MYEGEWNENRREGLGVATYKGANTVTVLFCILKSRIRNIFLLGYLWEGVNKKLDFLADMSAEL